MIRGNSGDSTGYCSPPMYWTKAIMKIGAGPSLLGREGDLEDKLSWTPHALIGLKLERICSMTYVFAACPLPMQ